MMQKPEKFIAEVKLNYSDDSGAGLEKRWVFRPQMTYDDFMQESDKMFHFCRAMYGAEEFDKLMEENKEDDVEIEAVDNVRPFPKTVVTDKEV